MNYKENFNTFPNVETVSQHNKCRSNESLNGDKNNHIEVNKTLAKVIIALENGILKFNQTMQKIMKIRAPLNYKRKG